VSASHLQKANISSPNDPEGPPAEHRRVFQLVHIYFGIGPQDSAALKAMDDLPEIIRAKLFEGPLGSEELAAALSVPETNVLIELVKLHKEGFVKLENHKWSVTDDSD
jgi:hypothetical protein